MQRFVQRFVQAKWGRHNLQNPHGVAQAGRLGVTDPPSWGQPEKKEKPN